MSEDIATEKVTLGESEKKAKETNKVDQNPFECDLCESKFRKKRGLSAHKGHAHKTISQLDGAGEEPEDECIYTFVSDYAREDIDYTLEEVLSEGIECEMISREKIGHERSAEHLCTIRVVIPSDAWQWPVMVGVQKIVIKDLKPNSSCC